MRPRRPNAKSVDVMRGPFHAIGYDGDVEYQVTSVWKDKRFGVIRVTTPGTDPRILPRLSC